MAGGLLQIVSYGSQDLFLTGNPEITYFRTVYRRHTNFACEAVKVLFDDTVGFGTTSNVVIPKIGDLVHKTYVEITIPEFYYTRTLNQQTINELTNQVSSLQNKYNVLKSFLSVNIQAYRDAYDLYISDNITMSNEMIDIITTDFSTYISSQSETEFKQFIADDYNAEKQTILDNGGILYRYENMDNMLGNISLTSIANYWNPPTLSPYVVPKATTMAIINFLIENCKKLDKKYHDELAVAKTALLDAYNTNYKFAWVERLGHAIMDYIEIWIGGHKIDKHFGMWLDIWYELMGKKEQSTSYDKMIGNISTLTTYDRTTKPSYNMKIPLQFWFCRYSGLALPLVALQYDDVSIRIKFRKFSECSYIEANSTNDAVSLDDILENKNKDITANLLVEYVYLDSPERKKFAQSSHEYLIDQLQINYDSTLYDKTYALDVDFEEPCKGLIWVLQNENLLKNTDGHTQCHWTTYTSTYGGTVPILDSYIGFAGYDRVMKLEYNYFNYVQPWQHAHNTPVDGINSYWFSLFPIEHQPSGQCNMSRLPRVRMQFTIDPYFYDNNVPYTLTVFTLNYNILRIIGGMGNTAYISAN